MISGSKSTMWLKVPTGALTLILNQGLDVARLDIMDKGDLASNPLQTNYGAHISKINDALESEIQMYSESEFASPLRYAINNGKRIRPLILVLVADCLGGITKDAYTASCAVEFLHTESVIHDDIIDSEDARRDIDPFHIKYGYNTAILTGDFVLGMILNMASKIDDIRVTQDLATTAMLMSEGEVLESKLCAIADITFDDYLKVIRYKTATAFEAAARIGAVITNGTEKQIAAMTEFGNSLGIAYQIRDDLADWNDEEKLFNSLIKQGTDPRAAFDKMEILLKKYADTARLSLAALPDHPSRRALEGLVEFTAPRTGTSTQ